MALLRTSRISLGSYESTEPNVGEGWFKDVFTCPPGFRAIVKDVYVQLWGSQNLDHYYELGIYVTSGVEEYTAIHELESFASDYALAERRSMMQVLNESDTLVFIADWDYLNWSISGALLPIQAGEGARSTGSVVVSDHGTSAIGSRVDRLGRRARRQRIPL